MGRKNKYIVQITPFCYYCDKEFNNELILQQHQKAKHFSCPDCNKRFSTAPSLEVHYLHVHKKDLKLVPNAIKGREGLNISIYGMDCVPMELLHSKLEEKIQRKKRMLINKGELNEMEFP